MKVRDLIKHLKKCNPNHEVIIQVEDEEVFVISNMYMNDNKDKVVLGVISEEGN